MPKSSPVTPLELKGLHAWVHAALRAWHSLGGTPEDLLEPLLLVQERRAATAGENNPAAARYATNHVLMSGLDELATQDDLAAQVLRARFLDDHKIRAVASKLNMSVDSVNRVQAVAIQRLAQIVWNHEQELRERRALEMEAHLQPPQYLELFGFDHIRQQLLDRLLKPEAPWVTAIVGIGGIGKTALADTVARQVIRHFRFEQVFWVRAEPGRLGPATPRLTFETLLSKLSEALWPHRTDGDSPDEQAVRVRQALKARPHLIVIDNLETEADTAYLLERLNDLAVPSKFLLTSRTRPPRQAAVFAVLLDELKFEDALSLLRHHAAQIGQTSLVRVPKKQVRSVYRVIGGNPLAIKLVVGLAAVQPLSQILDDLARSRPGEIEDLYRHIYWGAWRTLSAEARALLQAMPLVAEKGALPAQMRAFSGLPEEQLWPAIHELADRSLLEVRGTAVERRYSIHHLTETFLRTEIIDWPEVGA
jgi:hypothetical protein